MAAEPRPAARVPFGIAAVAVVLVFGVLAAVFAQPTPIIDAAPVPDSVSSPPGSQVTITPDIPPFYRVGTVPPASPGAMIKTEELSGGPAGTRTYRIMYHSQDNTGNDVPVSGLYVTPATAPPAGGFPLIAYAHGTTGSNQHCGISLTPFQKSTPGYSSYERQMLPLVQQGWAVVGTDYQGEGAPGYPTYLVGKTEGQNVLDSVRAVHNWRSDVNRDRSVIWGHSQGGHSATFAAQMAPSYAPELRFQGAAILAPGLLPTLPLAVDGLLAGTEPSGMTGFVMLIVTSWTQTYPGTITAAELVTPAGLERLPVVNSKCGDGYDAPFQTAPMSAFVKSPPAEFYTLMSLNTPGMIPLTMPVVMVQGMKDTTIIPQLTLGFNKQLCQFGDTVSFHIYPDDNHPAVVVSSRDLINGWIRDRFAGKPAPDNCPNKL